jgi:2-O-methyltransferase
MMDILDKVSLLLNKENINVLEAGSHNGSDTEIMARLWTKGHIYGFEPFSELYDTAVERTKWYKNVSIEKIALSNCNGKCKFFVDNGGDYGASSLLEPTDAYLKNYLKSGIYEIEVETMTIDSWMKKRGVQEINFMWLDMEGTELQVLKASPIAMNKVDAIYTEVNFSKFRNGETTYNAIDSFLKDKGFVSIVNTPQGTDKWGEWQGNCLYVLKKYVNKWLI